MRKRTITEFSKTLSVALILCIFSYTGTASFGYLTFGSDVKQDILESYKPTPDVLVAVIGLAAKMYTTYPILMFGYDIALYSCNVMVNKSVVALVTDSTNDVLG
jgi:sodium-coupled neutral amino acid transporter 7/8